MTTRSCVWAFALLATAHDMEVVGEAADGHAAINQALQLKPDVVVMDVVMTGMDGLTATRELASRTPDARVIALTMHDEADYLIPLIEAGAAGYIVKDAASSDLLEPFAPWLPVVDTYRRRINEKMGFTDRSDYVRLAVELGLLTSDTATPRVEGKSGND